MDNQGRGPDEPSRTLSNESSDDRGLHGRIEVSSEAEYEAAISRYEESLTRRDQIPSTREVETGEAEYEFKPVPSLPKIKRKGILRVLKEQVQVLDPRKIATRGNRYPLVVLSLLNTAGSFDDVAFRILIIYIRVDMGFNLGFMFAALALIDTVQIVAAPFIGYVVDRVKRVHMIRIGAVIDNFSSILTALAPNPVTLVASKIVGATGPAIHAPAAAPLLADYFPMELRARVFGFRYMTFLVWNLASTTLLVSGLFLTGLMTWRQLLLIAGVLASVVSVLTFWLKEPVRGEVDRLSMGLKPEQAKRPQKPVGWAEAWRVVKSIGTIRKLWYATPFLTVAQRGLGLFLFVALQTRFATAAQGGGLSGLLLSNPRFAAFVPVLFLLIPSAIQIAMTPYATLLADKLMRRRPGRIMYYFALLTVAQGIGAASVLIVPDPLIGMVFNWGVAGLSGLIGPAQGLLLSVVVPARVRGQGMQSIAPFQLVGMALFATLGLLANEFGPTTGAMLMVPVLIVGALIIGSSGVHVERDIRNALAASVAEEEAVAAAARGRAKMLVMRNVEVQYEGTQVIFDLNFDVEDGELVAVLGTNGAGKSTLLAAIAGIHEVSGGAIFLDGSDITHKPPHLNAKDGIVFLPGGRAIFPTLTVEENLRTAAWLFEDREPEYVRDRTEKILEYFPILRERMNLKAGDLSGGEQQMLALGQAFLMRPRLLMIDELSMGLAPQVVEKLLEIVRAIHDQGTSILLVEQSVNVATTIAKRAVFMDRGRIRFDGPVEELMGRGELVRAIFLGSTGGSAFVGAGTSRKARYGEVPERAVAVENIHVSYGGVNALMDVTMEAHAGEVVGVIGPNGAGKTTLFEVISGFTSPDEGRVFLGPKEVTRLAPDARARLGLSRSFQDSRLFQSLTVRETIAVALERRIQGRSAVLAAAWAPTIRKAERRAFRRVDYLVNLLGLEAYADKFVSELSTGSRRMVDIACVMAAEPKVLLLDEPSSGMAQAEIEVFGPVVKRLGQETGSAVIVIEHDIALCTGMSDRIYAMQLGKIIASGDPLSVMEDERVIASYLTASETTIRRSDSFGKALAALRPTTKDS